jgi:hypothetical protein
MQIAQHSSFRAYMEGIKVGVHEMEALNNLTWRGGQRRLLLNLCELQNSFY